jgi:hypothetical protein
VLLEDHDTKPARPGRTQRHVCSQSDTSLSQSRHHPPKQERERRLPARLDSYESSALDFVHNIGSRLHPQARRQRLAMCCDRRLSSADGGVLERCCRP